MIWNMKIWIKMLMLFEMTSNGFKFYSLEDFDDIMKKIFQIERWFHWNQLKHWYKEKNEKTSVEVNEKSFKSTFKRRICFMN
jgi:hypothetical protein